MGNQHGARHVELDGGVGALENLNSAGLPRAGGTGIYQHDGVRYAPLAEWNAACNECDHAELFKRVQTEVGGLIDWVNARFRATVYADPYSPFS